MKINNTTPAFTHKVIVDIGASNPKGSCKVRVTSNDGKVEYYKQEGFLNNSTDGFRKTLDPVTGEFDGGQRTFINRLHLQIKHASTLVQNKMKLGEIKAPESEQKLAGAAVFVPGTTFTHMKDDRIAFIPNLRDTEGNSLVEIDFKKYEQEVKEGKGRGRDLNVADDFELVVTKDLGGTGLGIAQCMAKQGMLNTGDYIMGVMTGGGFGSVDIKVKEDEKGKQYVEFETSESSSYLTGNVTMYEKILNTIRKTLKSSNPERALAELTYDDNKKLQETIPILGKLGRQGVSVKSHLKCFFQALDLGLTKEEAEEFMSMVLRVGDARIVSDDFMYVSEADHELVEKIDNSKYFERIESDKSGKVKYTLNKKEISPEKIKQARIHAVNDYANAVSLISINKINDCINKVVLVGPFAQGLNRHVRDFADEYGAKDLADLITQKIKQNISEKYADLPSSKRLMELYDFQVICDPNINIKDNTAAGDLLLNKQLSFTPNRGSWFRVPMDALTGEGKIAEKESNLVAKNDSVMDGKIANIDFNKKPEVAKKLSFEQDVDAAD